MLSYLPNGVYCRARIKKGAGEWVLISTKVGEGIAGQVAESGRSMNIKDAYACKIFNPAIDRATNFKTKSVLCCPIADISGKHVAVVQVHVCPTNLPSLTDYTP